MLIASFVRVVLTMPQVTFICGEHPSLIINKPTPPSKKGPGYNKTAYNQIWID